MNEDNMIIGKDQLYAVLKDIKLSHAAKCRNTSGTSIMQHFIVDVNGCTLHEVLLAALSSWTISGQRAWEKMTPDELRETVNGKTFHASAIGRKPKSDADVKREYKARFDASSNQDKARMIAELQASMVSVVSEEQAEDERSAMQDAYDDEEDEDE